jgi:hypothetical protein
MDEAVEICKLRLFLKLAAQVEPDSARNNLGIEPLPDIDFNIRAGNTLVGYTNYDQVKKVVTSKLDLDNAMEKITVRAADLQQTFDAFRQRQIEGDGSVPTEHKLALRQRLRPLKDELNRHLAAEFGVTVADGVAYGKWVKSHRPFHWFVEFYGIMNGGGFDAIIGNPPWKEYAAVKKSYTVLNYATESSGNLYALCTERSLELLAEGGLMSFIVQLPLVSSDRMETTRNLLFREACLLALIPCDDRPGKLFDGLQHCRSAIFVLKRNTRAAQCALWTTAYRRWATAARPLLLSTSVFAELRSGEICQGQFPKLASRQEVAAFEKLSVHSNARLGVRALRRAADAFIFLSGVCSVLG